MASGDRQLVRSEAVCALDQVFGLAARAIERCVNVFGAAFVQRGDHITAIEAPAKQIVFLARAGLDARDGAAFPDPGFGSIARLGIPTQRGNSLSGALPHDALLERIGRA